MNRKVSAVCLILLSLFLSVLIAARCIPAVSSDGLYSLSFYRDIFERQIPIQGWYLTPAPYFFPDLTFMLGFFSVFQEEGYGFAAYIVLFGLLLPLFACAIERNARSTQASFPLMLTGLALFWAATALSGQANMIPYFLFFPTYHGGILLLILASLWLLVRSISKTPRWPYVSLFILTSVGVLSDLLIVPQFLFPALVALWWCSRGYFDRKHIYRLAALFGAATLTGYGTHLYLLKSGTFSIGSGISHVLVGSYQKSLAAFAKDIPLFFTEFWTYSVFGVLWILLVVVGLRGSTVKMRSSQSEPEARRRFLLAYAALATVLSCAVAVLNGGYDSLGISRRFLPTFVFPFLFLFAAVGPHTLFDRNWRLLPTAAFLIALAVNVPSLRSFQWASLKLPYPLDVECIDGVAESLGARWGVGDYWSAKYVSELSKKGVWVQQITEDLSPYRWIANPHWFSHDVNGVKRDYRFAILNNLNSEAPALAAPIDIRECGKLRIAVYDRSLLMP